MPAVSNESTGQLGLTYTPTDLLVVECTKIGYGSPEKVLGPDQSYPASNF
jgi:hypothetical protein